MKIFLGLCFVVFGCLGIDPGVEDNFKPSNIVKRAIDGSRGRKYYEPEEEDTFEIYQSDENYDSDDQDGFADIRKNVPGEPGIDYPAYRIIPQTSFTCDTQFRGYYADEEAGCQLFHVCDGNFLISSFLCPIGSTFSQKLLTCDWWNKVDCSLTKNYYIINSQTASISEADDDEILRKAYEIKNFESSANENLNNKYTTLNDLKIDQNNYQQKNKFSSRYSALDQHDRDIDYYPNLSDENSNYSGIKIHTIGQDYKNDIDNNHKKNNRNSYMPTVPTVTTTKRTYYSPTVPAITTRSSKYDLEFESSDHLYSARGNKILVKSTTIEPIIHEINSTESSSKNNESIENKDLSKTNEIKSTQINQISSPISSENNNNDISSEFSIYKIGDLDLGVNSPDEVLKNYSKLVSVSQDVYEGDKNIFIPPTDIIPPYFYYSNIAQHNAVTDKTNINFEINSTTSWSDPIDINFPATDAIPPSFYFSKNKDDEKYKNNDNKFNKTDQINYQIVNEDFKISKNLSHQNINSSSGELNDTGLFFDLKNSTRNIPLPSKIFLPPLFEYFTRNSSGVLENYDYDLTENQEDIEENNDKKFSDSAEGESSSYQVILNVTNRDGGFSFDDNLSKSQLNSENDQSQQGNPRNNFRIINTTDFDKKNQTLLLEVKNEKNMNFTNEKSDKNINFKLPHLSRNIDFQSGHEISKIKVKNKIEENINNKDILQIEKSVEKRGGSYRVETEFIPSLGFSLNTSEERNKFINAFSSQDVEK